MESTKKEIFDVLYVDDEASNLARLKYTFRDEYKLKFAASGKEGLKIMQQQEFKVVIADLRMPEMDGSQFLEIVTKKYPLSVRIALTAYSHSEIVLDAINIGGVYRYLTKPWKKEELKSTIDSAIQLYNLKFQNQKLITELKETNTLLRKEIDERKKTEKELEKYQSHLETMVKERTEEIQSLNEELRVINEELNITNNDLQSINKQLRQEIDEKTKVQKALADSEEIFRNYMEQSYDGIILSDTSGKIIKENKSMINITGTKNKLVNKYVWDAAFNLIPNENKKSENINTLKERIKKDLSNIKKFKPFEFERKIITENKKEKYINFTLFPIKTNSGHYMGTIAKDITENKMFTIELEQYKNHLEELVEQRTIELKKSEEKFLNVFKYSPGFIIISELNSGKIIDVNDAFANKFNLNVNNIKGKKLCELEIITEDERKSYTRILKEKGFYKNLEIILKSKSGKKLNCLTSGEILEIGNSKVSLQVITDITERKEAEKNLHLSQFSIEQNTNAIYWIASNGIFKYVNEAVCKILGYTKDEIYTKKAHDISDKITKENWRAMWNKIKSLGTLRQESVHIRKDGSKFPVMITADYHKYQDTELIFAYATDISEQKRWEKAIVESERNYREIFNATNEAIIVHDANTGKIHDVNKAMLELFNIEYEEALKCSPNDFTGTTSEIQYSELIKVASKKGVQVFNWNALKKSGEEFWAEVSLRSTEIAGFKRVLAVIRDITERKQYEEALKQSDDLFNNIQTGIHIYELQDINDDKSLIMVTANPATEKLTGVKVKDVVGKTLDENFPGLRAKNVPQLYAKVVRTQKPIEIENITYGDNRVIEGAFSVKAFPLPNKKVGVAFENITEKKKAEDDLRKSEERYRGLFEQAADGILVGNIDGKLTDVNSSMLKLSGYRRNEIVGSNIKSLFEKEVLKDKPLRHDLVASGKNVITERDLRRKDGKIINIEMNTKQLANGVVQSLIRDITQRKQMEIALKENEERYRILFETATDGIFMMKEEKFVDCNPAAQIIFDSTKEDIINSTPIDFSPEFQTDGISSKQKALMYIKEAYNGKTQFFEWQHKRKNNKIFDAEVILKRIELSGGIFLQAILRDITERKEAEKLLIKSESKFRNIFNNSSDGILMLTPNLKILQGNKNFLELTRYNQDELDKLKLPNLFTDTDFRLFHNSVEEIKKTELSSTIEVKVKTKENQLIPCEISNKIIDNEGEKALLSVIRDISERKKAEKKILDAILSTEEKEREKFAKNLHDDLGPLLSSIKMYVNSIVELNNEAKQVFISQQLNDIVTEAIQCTKDISNDLSPHVLSNYGIISAVEAFTKKMTEYIKINLTTNLSTQRFKSDIETSLYRIIKELINNTIKHANADKIMLRITYEEKWLHIKYEDNGIGFNLEKIEKPQKTGMGVPNIISRIRSLNGNYQFNKKIKGMSMEINIPAQIQ